MTKRTKLSEFKHFNKLANEWWSESGKYKILHITNPIRIRYILNHIDSEKINNLEVFSGSGEIFSEKFKIRGLPTTVLIDKNGYEFARIVGYIDFENKSFLDWLNNNL